MTRLSSDVLPYRKRKQDYEKPDPSQGFSYNFERHIIGVGYFDGQHEYYFIFSDGTQTEMQKVRNKCLIREVFLKPQGTTVKKVRVYYYDDHGDENDGSLRGVEMYDKYNTCLLYTHRAKVLDPRYKLKEIVLEDGERLIGIKSGLRK